MGAVERLPDFLDIGGRLHTVHRRKKPMTEEEFLQRVDPVYDASIVSTKPKSDIGISEQRGFLELPAVVDVGEMSNEVFQRHLDKL